MAFRYIIPALALASTALAQCDGPSITIKTSADAQQIASCQTYNGNVNIDSSATGTIALDGVQKINGDLNIVNATNLNSVTSDKLATITGTFNMNGLILLSSLQFSSLTGVNHINWINLPALQQLNFAKGVSQANTVYISNTFLNTLAGIELSQVGAMDVNNNPSLSMINVNSLTNVTDSLSFSANNKNLDISFPNLGQAGNLTFRNVSSIEMPSLQMVPGSMGFYSDTFLNFSAPNLTTIGQSLAFQDCPALTYVGMSALTQIGGAFILGNNSKLGAIDGFDSLQNVGGAIDFAGSFSAVAFPALKYVKGGANVQTTSTNSTICNEFNSAHSAGAIQGNVKCANGVANPQNNGTTTSSSGSSTSSKSAAIASFDPSAPFTGVFGLVAALLLL